MLAAARAAWRCANMQWVLVQIAAATLYGRQGALGRQAWLSKLAACKTLAKAALSRAAVYKPINDPEDGVRIYTASPCQHPTDGFNSRTLAVAGSSNPAKEPS